MNISTTGIPAGSISMVRTFIAIELSPAVRSEIGKIQPDLRQCRARLTLVNPEIIHITLKFLGEVSSEDLSTVTRALEKIRLEPFTINVSGVGVNNPRSPRVIWAGVDPIEPCKILNERIEAALEPLGFAREKRAYTPHATIARVREHDRSLEAAIGPHANREFGRCLIDRFSLKKSVLTPKGPVYETVAEVVW
ncbi:MAG TPA: RNA 2',3'-cyclic phosphodiesterase [Methanoregulaceae archaeon]|nr:RNA 2',3'-cyclic phosphodiesterase [Methanoregulaceae archaeon]